MRAFRYLMCILPPLAVIFCKKPGQALFSALLTLLFYFPGVIHAIAVVASYHGEQRRREDDRRHKETLEALRGGRP